MRRWVSRIFLCVLAGSSLVVHTLAVAESNTEHTAIAAQPLESALKALGEKTGLQIVYVTEVVEGKVSQGAPAGLAAREALERVLEGTGLTYKFLTEHAVAIQRKGEKKAALAGDGWRLASGESAGSNAAGGAQEQNERAGTSPGKNSDALDEVVVTAQKREQTIQEVPMSIIAMRGEEMEARGIDSLLDLAAAVPGLDLQDTTQQRRIFLRGIANFSGNDSLVGVYVDEAAVTGDSDDQIDLRIYDLDRVEVLRGPQGTLYGAGAAGGTIRYITKDPRFNEVEGKADVSSAFTSDGSPSYEARGALNIPLVTDKLAMRVTGGYSRAGGWVDQPAVGREDINDPRISNVRIKTLWRPTEAFEAKLMAIVYRNDAGAPTVSIDEDRTYRQSAIDPTKTPTYENDYEMYNATLSYDFGPVRLLSSSSWLNSDSSLKNYGREAFVSPPPAPPWELMLDADSGIEIFTQELRLTNGQSGPLTWIVGGFLRDSLFTSNALTRINFGAPPYINSPYVNNLYSDSWAAFGDLSYGLTERLEIGAGLRYFEDDQKERRATGTRTAKFHSLSPRLYAKFGINDRLNLYANIAKGFRSGGFNSLGPATYGPEEIWSYEIGTKAILADQRVDLNFAAFFSTYKDYQDYGILPPPNLPLAVTRNTGEAEIKGVECEIFWRPTRGVTLGLNGTYIDAQLTRANTALSQLEVGDDLNQITPYSFTASSSYSFNWSPAVIGFARLDYNHKAAATYRDRITQPFYIGRSDVIGFLNAQIGAQKDQWTLELFGENLLDENGLLNPNLITGSAARPRPRTIGIRVGMEF